MAKHGRARHAQNQGRPSRRATAVRAGVVGVGLAACVVGSFRLFTSATRAADTPPAALNGARHAGLRPVSVGIASRPPRTPGPSSSASPSPPARKHVSGASVTAIGDSVMVASTPALDKALPGIEINAMVGRQFYTGLQVIAQLKASGQLRQIVVVGLGTNGTVTAQEIGQLYAEIGPNRRLVLVNTFEARSWEQEVNSMLARAVRDHPASTVLANWYTTIEHRTNLLWPDGIHPQPSGGVIYAKMLRSALDRAVNLPG